MEQETVQYILSYYLHLMDHPARLTFIYTQQVYKHKNMKESHHALTLRYRQLGWISENDDVLTLLKDGFDAFETKVAVRIFNQHKDKIHFNRCPECGRLARTPQAQQCRYCGGSWREGEAKIR